ncbi:hypothetical protein GVAV_001204 [Gurleya vavrai]
MIYFLFSVNASFEDLCLEFEKLAINTFDGLLSESEIFAMITLEGLFPESEKDTIYTFESLYSESKRNAMDNFQMVSRILKENDYIAYKLLERSKILCDGFISHFDDLLKSLVSILDKEKAKILIINLIDLLNFIQNYTNSNKNENIIIIDDIYKSLYKKIYEMCTEVDLKELKIIIFYEILFEQLWRICVYIPHYSEFMTQIIIYCVTKRKEIIDRYYQELKVNSIKKNKI